MDQWQNQQLQMAGVSLVQKLMRKRNRYPTEESIKKVPIYAWIIPLCILIILEPLLLPAMILAADKNMPVPAMITLNLFMVFAWGLAILFAAGYKFYFANQYVGTTFFNHFQKTVAYNNIDKILILEKSLIMQVFNGKKSVGFRYGMYDASLTFIRILEQLQLRPITIDNIAPNHPDWPTKAQQTREFLATYIYQLHGDYYAYYPQEYASLQRLSVPPGYPIYGNQLGMSIAY